MPYSSAALHCCKAPIVRSITREVAEWKTSCCGFGGMQVEIFQLQPETTATCFPFSDLSGDAPDDWRASGRARKTALVLVAASKVTLPTRCRAQRRGRDPQKAKKPTSFRVWRSFLLRSSLAFCSLARCALQQWRAAGRQRYAVGCIYGTAVAFFH